MHGNPPSKAVEDQLFCRRVKRPCDRREKRLIGVFAIPIAQGIANGFSGPANVVGDAAADFGQAGDALPDQVAGPGADRLALTLVCKDRR